MARECCAGLMTLEFVATRPCFSSVFNSFAALLAWHGYCNARVSQGTFEHNVFQGHGVLEWSVKAGAGEC